MFLFLQGAPGADGGVISQCDLGSSVGNIPSICQVTVTIQSPQGAVACPLKPATPTPPPMLTAQVK